MDFKHPVLKGLVVNLHWRKGKALKVMIINFIKLIANLIAPVDHLLILE